jgi:hypothetical protein
MSFNQFIDYPDFPSAAPETGILTTPVGRQEELYSLQQAASAILFKLRSVRETWPDTDVPPTHEKRVLQQILVCLTISRDPSAGDEFDRIAAAGQQLSLLIDRPSAAFEADAADDADYDLVDFDADLDDAEWLVERHGL